MDPLSLLERKDKWFLGGGKGAIYAPPFPHWLEKPGFWDECYFADIRLTRLYTVLFCEIDGKPARFKAAIISWRPDRLILEHQGAGRVIRETRLVTEAHQWVSAFELLEGEPISAFLWSLPELKEPGHGTPWQSLTSCEVHENSISYEFATAWPEELEPDRTGVEQEAIKVPSHAYGGGEMLPPLSIHLNLTANLPRISQTVNLAQRHDDSPLWETSLLPQKLRDGKLPGDFKLEVGPPPREGLVHIVQQYLLEPSKPLVVSCQANLTRDFLTAPTFEVIKENEVAWRTYFASVPKFHSSDPYLTNAYWYRWYGLRLNTVDIPTLPIQTTSHNPQFSSPYITEGIGFFRNFVTYSGQAHLREVAWMHSPKVALGILENLNKCQRVDGSFPGHNYSCRPARDFYHADFATGMKNLEDLHELNIPNTVVISMRDYALYLCWTRAFFRSSELGEDNPWNENWSLVSINDQNETGQEYMSRYAAASSTFDQWTSFRIGGVDSTTYAALLCRFLAWRPGVPSGVSKRFSFYDMGDRAFSWEDAAEALESALLLYSFDGAAKRFRDVLELNVFSTEFPAASFYPYLAFRWLTKFSGHESNPIGQAIQGIEELFLSPSHFWLPKGFPATTLSDPTFSADAEWKEKRLNCPWNGRSWPMVNSHLVDAIANVARHQTPNPQDLAIEVLRPEESDENRALRIKAGEGLMKAITLMFHDGDPTRPNSYEHYDPITGTPSLYRGYDDYMHSWIVDLIMRHAVGVQPGQDDVDPLPLGVGWIECTDIPHPKGRMNVRIENDKVVRCEVIDFGTETPENSV